MSGAVRERMLADYVLRWARDNDWQRTYVRHCWRSGDGLTEVDWSVPEGWLTIHIRQTALDLTPTIVSVPVRSVREAVDVLVAYGVLPKWLSSAYGAGRASMLVGNWMRISEAAVAA